MTGMLSPVSILSFIMHYPVSNIKSHGIEHSLPLLSIVGISITSPGTNSVDVVHVSTFSSPERITLTGQL